MKKLLLLLVAGTMAMSASAQERHASVVFNHNNENATAKKNAHLSNKSTVANNLSGARVTSGPGGSRWYDYADSIFALETSISAVGVTEINLWNDTTDVVGYENSGTPTYYINTWTSVGLSFDPYVAEWSDSARFPKEIQVSATDAYTIDSVAVFGSYLRPTIAGTYTDVLKLSLVYGDGTSTSDLPGYYFSDAGMTTNFPYPQYNVDTINFIDLLHDSLTNTAGVTTAPGSVQTYTFALTSGDTATNFGRAYATHISVPVANYAALAISFISGDPSYVPFDTVQYADGSMKHGQFMPLVVFAETGTTAAYPPYNPLDQTNGYWKREGSGDDGWGGNYIPNWAWQSSGGGASPLQYPDAWFHVTCTTCGLNGPYSHVGVGNVKNITSINAVPNPANNEVTINFSLAASSNINISVTDMLGQVVKTQDVSNIANGKAVINTSSMPAGVYIYTLTANGERATGRIVVAH